MTFREYTDKCLEIRYSRRNPIKDFGDPMNCYGFVYWAYKLCFNKQLESFNVESFDEVQCVVYNKVDNPVDGDVVDLQTNTGHDRLHVGIVYGDYIYHFTVNGLVVENKYRMVDRIKGYYHVN